MSYNTGVCHMQAPGSFVQTCCNEKPVGHDSKLRGRWSHCSSASNLVSGDTNDCTDVFVRDRSEEEAARHKAFLRPFVVRLTKNRGRGSSAVRKLFNSKANHVLRAVYLDQGAHEVIFVYAPLSFKVGLYITIGTLFLVLLVALFGFKSFIEQRSEKNQNGNRL